MPLSRASTRGRYSRIVGVTLSPYLKTIIKYQTSPSIQCTYMKVFIISNLDAYHMRTNFIAKENYHAVLKDSQNDISEA